MLIICIFSYFLLYNKFIKIRCFGAFNCFDIVVETVSGQLPRRTIPHWTGFGPDKWFYSVVVVLVGSCPGGE